MDNLRLIVIATIFIGIIIVLLVIKSARRSGKTEKKYMQATNPYDSSGREESIKEKTGEGIEDTVESATVIEEKSVIDLETIKTIIKNTEAGFTAEIEGIISKIEEMEKEVINKLENIIDTKIQETLNKMNDRARTELQTEKDTTASVLEKPVGPLRAEEVPAGSLGPEKVEEVVEGKSDSGEEGEEDYWALLKETSDKDKDLLGELTGPLQTEKEETIASLGEIEENGPEKTDGDSADFDIQEFLKEANNGISSSDKSKVGVEGNVVPDEIKEEELEALSEDNADVSTEAEGPIASSEVVDKNISAIEEGDSADFDIQEFLKELGNFPSEDDHESEK